MTHFSQVLLEIREDQTNPQQGDNLRRQKEQLEPLLVTNQLQEMHKVSELL